MVATSTARACSSIGGATRLPPNSSAAELTSLSQGDVLEVRDERAGYLKVYNYRRERGGFVRADTVRAVGGTEADAPQLLAVLRFLRDSPGSEALGISYGAAYLKAIAGKPRRVVHPGDTINIQGLTAIVLTADGDHISAVPGVTPTANPACATEPHWDLDTTENPRSTGIVIRFGAFRFLDLGDLTKAKEIPLVCPSNLIGAVDLYLVNHHGFNLSNSRAFVDAIHPRVAIMDNGAHKAGSPEAWQTVHESPGLEDLWMLHTAEDSDVAHNSAPELIANPKGAPTDGAYLKVIASPDGSFSITNSRTGKTKDYPHS